MTVLGAVLAAGAGSRLGAPKAEVRLGTGRLLDHAVAALRCCPRVVAVVRDGTRCAGADLVVNPDPVRGMRSSLALAVAHAADEDAEALLAVPVDMPGLGLDACRAVLGAWRPGRIAVGSWSGLLRHPVVMDLDLWRVALDLAAPDEGARALLSTRPDLVDAVSVTGDPTDLDTAADLAAWQARR